MVQKNKFCQNKFDKLHCEEDLKLVKKVDKQSEINLNICPRNMKNIHVSRLLRIKPKIIQDESKKLEHNLNRNIFGKRYEYNKYKKKKRGGINKMLISILFCVIILLESCAQQQTQYVCPDGSTVSNPSFCPKQIPEGVVHCFTQNDCPPSQICSFDNGNPDRSRCVTPSPAAIPNPPPKFQ